MINNEATILDNGLVAMHHCEIHVCGQCNLRCNHCQYFAPLQAWIGSTESILRTLWAAQQRLKVEWFPICGVGEPLLHPDLPLIVNTVCEHRDFAARVTLVTNGVGLSSHKHTNILLELHEKYQHFDFIVSEHIPIPETKKWLEENNLRHEIRSLYPFVVKPAGFHKSDKYAAWKTGNAGDGSGACFKSRCRAIVDGKLFRCGIQAARYSLCKHGSATQKDFVDEVLRWDGIDLESSTSTEILAYLMDMPYDECCLCFEDLEQVAQSQMTETELMQYWEAFNE